MQYAIVAAALFGAAFAAPPSYGAPAYGAGETDTVYSTQVATITSCGPEVTNCPAEHSSTAAAVVPTDTCTDSSTVPAGAVPYSTPSAMPYQAASSSSEAGAQGTSAAGAAPPAYGVPSAGSSSCLLYTSPSPRDGLLSRMPSSA